jgi:hypothetical protein
MPMTEDHLSENIEEQFAVRNLASRGRDFVIAFFKDADVTEHELALVYHGMPIEPEPLGRIKKVLAERMPRE